jgi:hypothetical protein
MFNRKRWSCCLHRGHQSAHLTIGALPLLALMGTNGIKANARAPLAVASPETVPARGGDEDT